MTNLVRNDLQVKNEALCISHSGQFWILYNQTNKLAFIRIARYQPWRKWVIYNDLQNLGTSMNNFIAKWSKVEENALPTNPSQNAWYKPKKEGINQIDF